MAEHGLNDQQQQPQQQQNYGVGLGIRPRARVFPYVPRALARVPEYIGVPNIRAKSLPAPPVREQQQQQIMLQDDGMLVNQPLIQQHNLPQHNIAYNRMLDQLQVTTPNRPDGN